MKSYKKVLPTFIITILSGVAAIVVLGVQQPSTTQNKQNNKDDTEFRNQFPVADYEATEPVDPDRLSKRRRISRKFNKAIEPLNENTDTIVSFEHWATNLPALPVPQSDVIVVGSVESAKAYLAEDKSSVYSEFILKIDRTLKNGTPTQIDTGRSITVLRNGGRVRFPSGREVLQFTTGQGMPRAGKTYILFLKADTEQNLSILTGYELKAGHMELLDNPAGGTHPISKLEGVDEASFFSDLQNAISNPTMNN